MAPSGQTPCASGPWETYPCRPSRTPSGYQRCGWFWVSTSPVLPATTASANCDQCPVPLGLRQRPYDSPLQKIPRCHQPLWMRCWLTCHVTSSWSEQVSAQRPPKQLHVFNASKMFLRPAVVPTGEKVLRIMVFIDSIIIFIDTIFIDSIVLSNVRPPKFIKKSYVFCLHCHSEWKSVSFVK